MAAETSSRTRWIWSIACIAGISIVAVLLCWKLRSSDQASYDPDGTLTPNSVRLAEPTEAESSSVPPSNGESSHALDQAIRAAAVARSILDEVSDYSAVFSKHERVGRRVVSAKMNLKVRVEPFSVNLKFVEPKSVAGRRVVFVEGANGGNLLVLEAGYKSFLGVQALSPTGGLAMADNRHPITKIGLHQMVDLVIGQWEANRVHQDLTTRIESDVSLPTAEVCTVYESTIPTPREGVEFHKTRLWIDQKSGLAIRIEQLGFPAANDSSPSILEDYTYANVRTNVGLNDIDFDAKKAFQP